MISIQKNFLFVHVPKTGGNSIQSILKDYSEDKIIVRGNQDGINSFAVENEKYKTRKHSTLSAYKAALEPQLYSRLFKFSIIRNPWDRMVSLYFSARRRVVKEWDREAFVKLINRALPVRRFVVADSPFEAILGKLKIRGEQRGEPAYCTGFEKVLKKLKIQIDSVGFNKKNINHDIDFFIRFEALNEDFKLACNRLGIPYTPLPMRNKSEHKHYSRYYDDAMNEIVRKKFIEEIEFGGYKFKNA